MDQDTQDKLPLLQFDDKDLTEAKLTSKFKELNGKWANYAIKLHSDMKLHWGMYRTMEYTVDGIAAKVPEIFSLIETQLPHLLNSIFSRSEVIDARAKFSDPNGAKTYKIKSYINDLIKNKSDGRRKAELIIKNMLIYGWSITKMFWNTKPDHDVDPLTKQVVDINSAHPDFHMVDPFLFGYDPTYDGQKIDNLEWCKERVYIEKSSLKQMRDNGEVADFTDEDLASGESNDVKGSGTNDVKDKARGAAKTYYDEFWIRIFYKVPVMETRPVIGEDGLPTVDEFGQEVTEEVEVDTKTISDEFTAWFLSDSKIIKFQKNEFGFKPYTITRAYSNPNEFLGQGEPEIIGAIANQLSYVNYQAGKMVKKVGQNLTFITPGAGVSPQNLKRIEQGVLFVNDLNSIKSEQSTDPQNIQVLVKFKEYLNTELERLTGIGPTLQGESQGDMTATQASIVNQNASNRLANKLTHLQEDFIVPLAQIFFLMSKQLLQVPVEFFDTNNNLIELTPEDFNGNYSWVANGSITQSNKALQLQQNQLILQQLLQAAQASSNPQISSTPFTVDIPYFIQQYLGPYAELADMQNVIKPQQMTPMGQLPTQVGSNPPPIADPNRLSAQLEPKGINQSATMPIQGGLNFNK